MLLLCKGAINLKKVGVLSLVFGGPTVPYTDGISIATTAPGGRKGGPINSVLK